MLGDSVRRRAGGRRVRPVRAPRRRWAPTRTWWVVLGALALPFLAGYALATRGLFPEPDVAAEGTPVPSLVGRSVTEARRELSAAGLGGVAITELPDLDVPAGVVTAQSPLAGQQAPAGSAVRVAVSSGAPRVAVPDVRGFSLERARALLRGLGFEILEDREESSVPAGRVSSIQPGPGEVLELPVAVRIFVSTGTGLDPDTMGTDTLAAGWTAFPASPIFAVDRIFRRIARDGD